MKYLLIGFGISLGWGIGGTIGRMLDEIVANRRYEWKWYKKLNGIDENGKKKSNKSTVECRKIGFVVDNK